MWIILSLVIVSMFIVGCGTGQAVKAGKVAKQVPTSLKPMPPFIAAIDDDSPASDNLLVVKVLGLLDDKYNIPIGVVKLFSEVEGSSLDNQVTLIVLDGKGKVVVGENSPASQILFASEVAQALINVLSIDIVKSSSEVDSNDFKTAFN